jgi:CheY-like chemotaxis protein
MPSGGTLSIETWNVTLEQDHGHDPDVPAGLYVMLVVRDTGCGMDKETRDRLFEPFFTTKAPGEGTGLGLSSVYGTIEQSGGALSVRSAPDEGTTFAIYLPRAVRTVEASSGDRITLVRTEGDETILVVEDEESVRQLTVMELEELGYRVLQAGSLDEAISASRGYDGRIDLMLSDVVLAETSGPDVYERLAVERPDMGVLYMSGHAERRIVNHGVLASGVQFIEKPFTAEQLGSKVWEALGSAARHEE